jgi:2-methylcitrate dehydratase PrpD
MTIAEEFVGWAWELELADLPAAVRESASLHLLDGVGTALAARRLHAADYAVAVGRAGGGPAEATIIGERLRVGAPWAALANGVLVHALDYDDTHTRGLIHASAVTLPAALAVSQEYQRSGAELLVAAVIGYEIAARLAAAAPHGFHARGFHATSVCGTFAAALISAKLSGLSQDQAVGALGIAGSQSSGSMEFLATGSSTKQVHPGWASLAGIVAARLAAAGASGPATIVEGERGLFALFTDQDVDAAAATKGLGSTWETEQITVKPYPACHLLHNTLDAARQVALPSTPSGEAEIEQILEVIVQVAPDSVAIVCEPAAAKQVPRSSYEAKFSVQWSVAAMLADGAANTSTYDAARLARPGLVALSRRVRYQVRAYAGPAANAPGDVEVVLRDGTRLTGHTPPGSRQTRSDREPVLAKFAANVGGVPEIAADLGAAVLDLPACQDISAITRLAADLAESWKPRGLR